EFSVRLPLAGRTRYETAAGDGNQQAAAPAPEGRRILVIDDNADALNVLGRLLKLCGHQVATAPSGKMGLDQVAAFQPDAVLLDLGMPEMDGYETARRLREMPQGQSVALVALTGWGQEEDRARTRDAGFDFHLVKPVDAARLQELFASLEVAT